MIRTDTMRPIHDNARGQAGVEATQVTQHVAHNIASGFEKAKVIRRLIVEASSDMHRRYFEEMLRKVEVAP